MKFSKKLCISTICALTLLSTSICSVNATNVYKEKQNDIKKVETSNSTNIDKKNKTNTITKNAETKKASKKIDISENYAYYISLSTYCYEYTGKAIKPKVTVRKSQEYNTVLTEGTDYTVSYSNNKKIGSYTAEIKVTGKGNYKGTITTHFTICKYDISKAKISEIPDQEYTGKNIQPTIKKVKYNGKVLEYEKDYTIYYSSYTNGTPLGTAYITISGKGDFNGSYKSVPFKVVPIKVTNVSAKLETNGIKVSWKKTSNTADFDGYSIFRTTSTTKNLEYKLLASVDKNTNYYLDTTPETTGKTYYYKVCTYKTIYGTKFYSLASNIPEVVFAKKVENLIVTSGSNKATLTWDQVTGADAYQIFRADSKNGEYVRVKTQKGQKNCKWTDKKVEQYKTYYYKVRCYAKTNSDKVYGDFSEMQSKTPIAKTKMKRSKYTGPKIIIKWKKLDDIDGYKLYRATSPNGKYKKIAKLSPNTTSYTDKKLSQGKVYFYRIRAFKNKDGKELYGQYSDIEYEVTGTRTQQLNKIDLQPDKDFKNSGFKAYYKRYNKIIKKVTNSKMSTYKKVKAIYDYLVQSLYHKDGYHCKHFAGTFAGLCRVLGLDAYCGEGQTRASGGGYTAHTWTLVNINGTEYIFDASLDRHQADRTKKKTSNYYFLKTYDELPGVYKFSNYENWWPMYMVYLKK